MRADTQNKTHAAMHQQETLAKISPSTTSDKLKPFQNPHALNEVHVCCTVFCLCNIHFLNQEYRRSSD